MTSAGFNVAVKHGFHLMSNHDMAMKCRAMLDKQPICLFTSLQAGHTYAYRRYDGADVTHVYLIGSVTPSGKQAMVQELPLGLAQKAYAGALSGQFIKLSQDLIDMIGYTHECVIEQAKLEGLYDKTPAPLAVKREHPQLFVEIPLRFGKNPENEKFGTAVARVRHALERLVGGVNRGPVTPVCVEAWIEEAHRNIAKLTCERTRKVVDDSSLAQDYDKYIDEYKGDIEFYRWLLPLVGKGGAFDGTGDGNANKTN